MKRLLLLLSVPILVFTSATSVEATGPGEVEKPKTLCQLITDLTFSFARMEQKLGVLAAKVDIYVTKLDGLEKEVTKLKEAVGTFEEVTAVPKIYAPFERAEEMRAKYKVIAPLLKTEDFSAWDRARVTDDIVLYLKELCEGNARVIEVKKGGTYNGIYFVEREKYVVGETQGKILIDAGFAKELTD